MKLSHLFMIVGIALGAVLAFWLLSQRHLPTLRASHLPGDSGQAPPKWIELE